VSDLCRAGLQWVCGLLTCNLWAPVRAGKRGQVELVMKLDVRRGFAAYERASQRRRWRFQQHFHLRRRRALTTSVYDVANQTETSADASGVTTYTFDADGNQQIVQKPGGALTTAVWDYENQNTLIELPDGSLVTMIYNADNRRIERLP